MDDDKNAQEKTNKQIKILKKENVTLHEDLDNKGVEILDILNEVTNKEDQISRLRIELEKLLKMI